MPEPPPPILGFAGEFGQFLKMFLERWPSYKPFWGKCRGIISPNNYGNLLTRSSDEQIESGKAPGRVLVYSQAATIEVVQFLPSTDHTEGRFELSSHGRIIGSMRFQNIQDEATALQALDSGPYKMEFLALSAIWNPWMGFDLKDNHIQDGQVYFEDCNGNPLKVISCMYIMAIEATNDGRYRRLGLGSIPLETWLELDREFRSIVLEWRFPCSSLWYLFGINCFFLRNNLVAHFLVRSHRHLSTEGRQI